jgi:hypothetical protein
MIGLDIGLDGWQDGQHSLICKSKPFVVDFVTVDWCRKVMVLRKAQRWWWVKTN